MGPRVLLGRRYCASCECSEGGKGRAQERSRQLGAPRGGLEEGDGQWEGRSIRGTCLGKWTQRAGAMGEVRAGPTGPRVGKGTHRGWGSRQGRERLRMESEGLREASGAPLVPAGLRSNPGSLRAFLHGSPAWPPSPSQASSSGKPSLSTPGCLPSGQREQKAGGSHGSGLE